jgi:hypothetical protein
MILTAYASSFQLDRGSVIVNAAIPNSTILPLKPNNRHTHNLTDYGPVRPARERRAKKARPLKGPQPKSEPGLAGFPY